MLYRLAIILTIGFSQAYAYVPPSEYIVNRIAQKRKKVRAIWVRSAIHIVEDEVPTSVHIKEVVTYHAKKKLLQSRVYDEEGKELYAMERALEPVSPGIPLLDYLLFEKEPQNIVQSLVYNRIPVKKEDELLLLNDEIQRRSNEPTFVKRWNEKFNWGIGSDPKNETTPQLWVEKDSFNLTRLILQEGTISSSSAPPIEFRFGKFKYAKGIPYPEETNLVKKGKTIVRASLDKVIINPKLKKFPEKLTAGYTQRGSEVSYDVKDLIQKFYTYFR